jgi:CheY-like chemotaxis protein
MPTVLIADDDPVSLGFLQTAIATLGCTAIAAENGSAALKLAGAGAVDLLLLDLHMPDAGGTVLLRALRARGVHAPAIATSAEFDAGSVAALHADGFADTLAKPASLDAIESLLRQHLALDARASPSQPADDSPTALPLLDDASALAAIGGDIDAMRALRKLFAQELDALEHDLRDVASPDSPALSGRLHRLRASSGFCGATALAAAALRLQCALGGDAARAAMADFAQTCSATRSALAGPSLESGART